MRALANHLLAGELTPRELAFQAHRRFGHRLPLAERLAELDDEYDTLEYSGRTPAQLDADVTSEAHHLAQQPRGSSEPTDTPAWSTLPRPVGSHSAAVLPVTARAIRHQGRAENAQAALPAEQRRARQLSLLEPWVTRGLTGREAVERRAALYAHRAGLRENEQLLDAVVTLEVRAELRGRG